MKVTIIKVCHIAVDDNDPAINLHTRSGTFVYGDHCTVTTTILSTHKASYEDGYIKK